MYCILGDCNKEICHHCFPVKKCSYGHSHCEENGIFKEIYHENRIVVTGCAGFIGSHLCDKLLQIPNIEVIGIDNYDPYYAVENKRSNIGILKSKYENFTFLQEDILTTKVIQKYKPHKVVHLASLAGVRNSLKKPEDYVKVNVQGFVNILQQCVDNNVMNVVYASSSSVYGTNSKVPFTETDPINQCNSPYAASKKAMESFAQTYSQLYNITTIGLWFFTVYGPRGRPDMAPYKFLHALKNDIPIDKYGDGSSMRDYTYVGDIVEGIMGALHNKNLRKCEVYNLGNNSPVSLNEFIETCEKVTGKCAQINQMEMQLGDVSCTYANIEKARKDLDYNPTTKLEDGLYKSL